MSGYAKRGFDKYIVDQQVKFYKIFKRDVLPVLPGFYTFDEIYSIFEEYYPFDLRAFEFELNGYRHQDKTLSKIQHRKRYYVKSPKKYLECGRGFEYALSPKFISARAETIEENNRKVQKEKFVEKRNKANAKMQIKINKAQNLAQEMEPEFLDKLMGLYLKKTSTQKDRVYILHELYKYDCKKVTDFLQREMNAQQNFQLREMVMKHLQDYGYSPKLKRKDAIPFHTKNKKKREKIKQYRNERFDISGIPEELSYLIENHKSQGLKSYDYFISHGYLDHDEVQKLIKCLNRDDINVYCDWISDRDYLKRFLVCEDTLKVIRKRIDISKAVLFADSENSRKSMWVAYELQYAEKTHKPIYTVGFDGMKEINELKDYWFRDIRVEKVPL